MEEQEKDGRTNPQGACNENSTILSQKEDPLPAPAGSCPRCRAANQAEEVFCRNCGYTLREFEVKDQRHSLVQARGQTLPGLAGTAVGGEKGQRVMRRTSTYIGRIRGIQPVPMQFEQPGQAQGQGDKVSSSVLIISVVSISMLVVVVLILVLVLVKYI